MKTIDIDIERSCGRCKKKATYFWIGPDTEAEAVAYGGGEFMEYCYLCDDHAVQSVQQSRGHDLRSAA